MNKVVILISSLTLLMSNPILAEEHNHKESGHSHESISSHDDFFGDGDKHKGHDAHDEGHKDKHDDHDTHDEGHEDKHDGHKETGGSHDGHDDHEEAAGPLKLSQEQIKQAGIETELIYYKSKSQVINAPGSVSFNAYKLADVTIQVDGVVHSRHVRLGDEVRKGQKLVTLTSSSLAQAEAGYLRAEAEHRKSKLDLKRTEGLLKDKIVSKSRFQQADSVHQAAHANLAASRATLASYGLPKDKIDALMQLNNYGQLTLYAPRSGTVVADDFRQGQHIAAGTRLLQIVDETSVWVEVKLSRSQLMGVSAGRPAVVTTKDNNSVYEARVINIHHQLDQTTRTVGVRLEVQNREDGLHPGMFVSAEIETGEGNEALLVPEQAIQRQGSELIVFVEEEPGHFERREVRVDKANMGHVPVLEGIKEGESIVVKGAFTLASELAKSGFEAHNH